MDNSLLTLSTGERSVGNQRQIIRSEPKDDWPQTMPPILYYLPLLSDSCLPSEPSELSQPVIVKVIQALIGGDIPMTEIFISTIF